MEDADQHRHADAARHHRKGRKAVAHDDGEQRHANHVHEHRDEAQIHVDVGGRDMSHGLAHAGIREHQAQHAQHLRQHQGPAHGFGQAARFAHALQRCLAGEPAGQGQRADAADGQAQQRGVLRVEQGRAVDLERRCGQGEGHRQHGDGQGRDEELVAQAPGAGGGFGHRAQRLLARSHAAETGR